MELVLVVVEKVELVVVEEAVEVAKVETVVDTSHD